MTALSDHRLRKHAEYQCVYREAGRKQWAKQIAFFCAARLPESSRAQRCALPGPRVGLTVPKALGKAVDRNRIKRRLRVLVKGALPILGAMPVDIILHPKRSVLDADFRELQREVEGIFRTVRARIQKAPQRPQVAAGKDAAS